MTTHGIREKAAIIDLRGPSRWSKQANQELAYARVIHIDKSYTFTFEVK